MALPMSEPIRIVWFDVINDRTKSVRLPHLSHYALRELKGVENIIVKTRPFAETLPGHNRIVRPRPNRLRKRIRSGIFRRFHPLAQINAIIPGLLLRERYDLVFTHMLGSYTTFCTLVIAHWVRRKPYAIMTEHWYPRRSHLTTWWYGRVVKGASLVVAQSTKSHRFMIEGLDADPARVVTLVNTVSDLVSQPYSESRRTEVEECDGLKVLSVGRFIECKGFDVLIRAFKRMKLPDVTLHLVGAADTPYGRKCRRLAGDDPRIVFHGKVSFDEVLAFYRGCDLFVLASKFTANPVEGAESFGYAPLEAACLGLPTILTTATGCVDDVVIEGETGFRLPEADENAMKRCLDSMLGDPGRLRVMGEMAQDQARRLSSAEAQSAFKSAFEALLWSLRETGEETGVNEEAGAAGG
jgi:glycosyltransferase involved in cell wall biosynthesis